MSIFTGISGKTFGQSLFQGSQGSISSDLLINKAYPGIILQATETNARQCELREVSGVLYKVNNATFNGTNWVCVNTAAEADGERIDAAGNWQKIKSPVTAGAITWTVVDTLDVSGNATVNSVIAPSIGPTGAQQHTVPGVTSDTVSLLAAVQTLTNKTLTSPSLNTQLTLVQTTGNYTVRWNNPSAGHVLTIADPAADDTFVFAAMNQTLTNKTFGGSSVGGTLLPFVIGRVNVQATVSSTVAETSFTGFPISIPGNTLGTTKGLRLRAFGVFLNNTGGAVTFLWKVKYGGQNQFSSGALSYSSFAGVNQWMLDVLIWQDNLTNNERGSGSILIPNTGGQGANTGTAMSTYGYVVDTPNTVDSTIAQNLDLTITMNTNSASATATLDGAVVEVV